MERVTAKHLSVGDIIRYQTFEDRMNGHNGDRELASIEHRNAGFTLTFTDGSTARGGNGTKWIRVSA